MAEIIDAKKAAKLIFDGATVGVDGFIGFCLADDVLCEMESRFVREGHPKKISVVNVAGIGGDGEKRGINRFAHEGFVGRLLCSNLSLAPRIYPYITGNSFPTFMIPQGVLAHLMRAIAGHKPGVITKVGMKTFVDPRVDGARINEAAKESKDEVVKLVEIDGEEYLFYPSFPLDFAVIKGSIADRDGNVSIENEAIHIEQFEMAAAAKNSGGKVIVQVDRIAEQGELHPQKVAVPGALVDYIVLGNPENSGQHFIGDGKPIPSWCGDEVVSDKSIETMPFDIRKVICRRAAMEVRKGDFINLGIGIPMNVSEVLNEEGLIKEVSFSIESGVTGGVPAPGLATGAAYNPVAILKQPDIFDFYDGGGIDFTCLGTAETDEKGNVNVSRFAGKVPGPGGFINISQGAKTVCFLGTFTSGGLDVAIEDGKLRIINEGKFKKFVKNVGHITFSGDHSVESGKQRVLYITERAVFELTPEGLELTETAPGIDPEKDIFPNMEFKPRISDKLKLMDEKLFRPEQMKLELA